MIKTLMVLAFWAAGIAFIAPPSAQAADDDVLNLLGKKLSIEVRQGGEERCYLNAEHIKRLATDAINKYCDLEIVPGSETNSSYSIALWWGLGRSVGAAGSNRINLCFSPFIVQFGRTIDANLIEKGSGNLRVYAEALSIYEAFVHQMTNQTRNYIYDRLPQRFTMYAQDLCGK